ncbi:hypothetical protein OX283_000670 [Flavobacterium sp. SUN052]|uniref:hypothetical protein n=1 Tax=Flavobacterium sp. SUN052 TaxID=3002441 RepID=UPI00237EB850|nr:hypothetical protein [Flavobacterium sp. SUN052]MEC4003153.1 hypothetical protein [Flavobacterium sp. SUN052]
MKKILILLLFFFYLNSNSQTTIYNTVLSKEKPTVKYKYLEGTNKLIIKEANDKKKLYSIFNKAILFDKDAKSTQLNDNEEFVSIFNSLNEENNATLMQDGASSLLLNFYNNTKKISFEIKPKDFAKYKIDFESDMVEMRPKINFDQNFVYAVTNENGRSNAIEIAKDALQLDKFDIAKQTSSVISLKKIDTDRLKTKDLDVPKQIAFQSRFYKNNTFEIVTKSVKKDYTSSTLYRDIYDLDGKFIKEISYNYNSLKGFLAPSSTNSTRENSQNSSNQNPDFHRDPIELDINDYFIDSKTNEFYIYGITTSKSNKNPLGFYINKYSEKGEKIWEKFYDVSDEKGFNESNQRLLEIKINLKQFTSENQLIISIVGFKTYTNHYNNFFVINKNSGNLEDTKSINSDSQTSKGTFSYGGKYSLFEIIKFDKNKFCDENTILTTTLKQDVKKYIDKITTKDDIFFNSILSSEGIWLLETDNKSYYKVIFF